jgi:DNA-directed RNA polymerase subunit M/transcription elongation factor TFIIS
VDLNPGDRASKCLGIMKPSRIEKKEENYILVHQCTKCGYEKRNKTAREDVFEEIIKLAKMNYENYSE